MYINLKLDIPKEYNDISNGEIAKLSMELKKIVDDLNFYLNRLDGENFTDKYNAEIESLAKRIAALETSVSTLNTKASKIIRTSGTFKGSNNVGGTITCSDVKAGDVIALGYGGNYIYNYGLYVTGVSAGKVTVNYIIRPSTAISVTETIALVIFRG